MGTRAFFTDDCARRGFVAVFFVRAPFFAPASGNTSIVQLMLRPARRGTVRFATTPDIAMRMPVRVSRTVA
jgi:hypothetical protein